MRALGTFSVQRLVAAALLLAYRWPKVDAVVSVGAVAAVAWALLAYEGVHYAESRRPCAGPPIR